MSDKKKSIIITVIIIIVAIIVAFCIWYYIRRRRNRGIVDTDRPTICYIPGGQWVETCANPSVVGTELRAQCYDDKEQLHNTTLDLTKCRGDIKNDNGLLKCTNNNGQTACIKSSCPMPAGSWIESCTSNVVNGHVLMAQCYDIEGKLQQTMIDISKCEPNTVTNTNGKLVCTPGITQC